MAETIVSSGVTSTGLHIIHEKMYVSSGGTANNTSVTGRYYGSDMYGTGFLYVSPGGEVNDTTVGWVGALNVSSGGVANSTVLNWGGSMFVSSGGTATDIVENGGYVYVEEGANVNFVPNTFFASIERGAFATLHSGTTANRISLESRCHLYIYSGGVANSTTVGKFGSMALFGGVTNSTELGFGGSLTVDSGGVANSTTATGSMFISSGGTANDTTLNRYGNMFVSSGGVANDTRVNYGGELYISSGGEANSASVNSGGSMFVSSGGEANSTTVNSRGSMFVSSGGEANSTTVNSGGSVIVTSGGTATEIVENGGYVSAEEGACVTYRSNTISELILISSAMSATLHDNTTADNITLNDGGKLYVYSGGTANNATLSIDGYLTVYSGGTANSASVSGHGSMTVSSGGTANDTTLNSYGKMFVSSGGTASTIVNSQGYLYIYSGGKLTGRMNFAVGVVSANEGAVVDFDISGVAPTNAALVNDLSRITGTPLYTLTVSGTQLDGTYKLAAGAAGFGSTLSVKGKTGEALGTLTVGQTTNISGVDYTLNLSGDNVLSVSVGAAVQSGFAKSDIDGNGISDVMFVWTGEHGEGNYQHGYWMNGTSEWQSANNGHPASWDNLGNYDMTGDGKADSVLFGNVDAYEVPSAYIGFYQDGIDTDENWVTIGFLTNAAGIDWKNKVGNLTGNASGVNSIVWYAPELSALGAWKDGAEDWVTLSSDFGGDAWTLVGCGDFNGDGKDSVLMTYNNGQMFYAVGIDEAPASLGSADWSGWEARAIGDFSGDGKDDIVLFHTDSGSMVMLADGNADNYASIGQLDKEDWFVVGAGDYNNDQKDDLLVRQYSSGMLGYYNACDTSDTGWVELGRGVDMQWTVIA